MTKDDRSAEVLAVAILFFILTWVSVCVRVYVRSVLTKNWGQDDSYMVAALFTFTFYLACQFVAVVHGSGRYQSTLTDNDTRTALLFLYLCELGYVVNNCLVKFAIGSLYLRVAVKRWHIAGIWTLMAGTFLCSLVYLFLIMFQCAPISVFWNEDPASSKCMSTHVTLGIRYALAAANTVTDWALGILAVAMLWSVEMEKKSRIFVAGVLAVAAIGCASTIIRACYLHTLVDGHDFLYATTDVGIWSTVEPGIGITAGSIVTFQPLIRKVLYCFGCTDAPNEQSLPRYHLSKRTQKQSQSYRRSLKSSDLVPEELNFITSHIEVLDATDREDKIDPPRDVVVDMELPCTKDGQIMQTISLHQKIEEPPKLELRKSFRNSFNGSSLVNFAKAYIP